MWRPQLLILQATPYCNINCRYCYLHNRQDRRVMPDEVVDAICKKILANVAPDAVPTIVWHAGEPTVIPAAWYRRAHERLKAAAPPAAAFRIQSNGIAISGEWIDFLRDTSTRIGLSIDGPQRFHDARRRTRTGGGTWTLVMKALRRLQECGIEPNVISVLHPDFLSAADEFYAFYKDHEITDISFSIDEAQGANPSSSFEKEDQKAAVTAFLVELLDRAFADRYPLRIRDIERMSNILAGNTRLDNEQLEPWQIVAVAANGDVTAFSPEFMDLAPETHDNLCFGNILTDDLHAIFKNERVAATQLEIRQGVEICRSSCKYFQVCGGGAPANKLAENGRLASGETVFCRHSIQAAADALIEFLSSARASRSAEQMLSRTAARPPAVALGRASH
jgi:uncharacterized protein